MSSTREAVRDSQDDYIMSRSLTANIRLNLQHYLWLETFKFRLHPSITGSRRPGEAWNVADVGSGTGQWLLDLANEVPSDWNLHGWDIDLGMALPETSRPHNVKMMKWDVMTPPPMQDYYDVIHVRLFAFVVKDNDPRRMLSSLIRMLKPGGYIQWMEPDFQNNHLSGFDGPECDSATIKLENAVQSYDARLRPTWVAMLPSFFAELGLHEVESQRTMGPHQVRYAYHACIQLAREEMIAALERRHGENGEAVISHEKAVELRSLLREAMLEMQRGTYFSLDRLCVVGRKPARKEQEALSGAERKPSKPDEGAGAFVLRTVVDVLRIMSL